MTDHQQVREALELAFEETDSGIVANKCQKALAALSRLEAAAAAEYERGRQDGMKQEHALWQMQRIGQEIEAAAVPELSREVRGWMCAVDWQHELGEASGGTKVYADLDDLKACHPGWKECGVVEVFIRSVPVGEVKPMTNAEIAELAETISDVEIMHHWNRRDAALHGKNAVIWFARAVIGAHLKATPPAPPEGWRPIETAPKDATEIFACQADSPERGLIYWDEALERWTEPADDWSEPNWKPTHWMPLPAAPQPGDKA